MIEDREMPAAPYLLGRPARELLEAALGELGGELLASKQRQVVYRPGRELIVRFEAEVRWRGSEPSTETIVVGTTPEGAPPGTVPLQADGMEVGVWRYPFDPALPGLAAAVVPRDAVDLVGDVVGGVPRLTLRTYRPGSRAVVQATGPDGEAYIKVVRPAAAGPLRAVHDALSPALPVPAVLHAEEELGLVVLAALPGDTLRTRLHGGQVPWPDAEEIGGLVNRIAAAGPVPGSRRVMPVREAVSAHLTMIERTLPTQAPRLQRLRDEIVVPRGGSTGPEVLIHGDLHDAQLMVESGRVTGILDIDGTGPGDPLDDLARMLGHLLTLALGAGTQRQAIEGYAARLHRDLLGSELVQAAGERELALRVASVIAGLATGPFRVQMKGWEAETKRRLAIAERWVAGGG